MSKATQNVITKTVCKANTWPQKDKKKKSYDHFTLHGLRSTWDKWLIPWQPFINFQRSLYEIRTWSTVTVVFILCLLTRKSHTRSLQVKQNTFPISLSHGDLLQTNCFYYPFMLFQTEFHLEILITTFIIGD